MVTSAQTEAANQVACSLFTHPSDRRRTSRGRSQSGVALAPSAGRAAGALLTVILLRFKTRSPEGWRRLQGTRLRWFVAALSWRSQPRGLERADAAVARRA